MAEWVTVTAIVAYAAEEGARVSGTRPSVPSRDLLRLCVRVGIKKEDEEHREQVRDDKTEERHFD